MSRLPVPPSSAPALITGGSSGIGLAMARRIVAAGRPVAIVARDELRLAAAVTELKAVRADAHILAVAADVGEADAVERAVAATTARFGPLGLAIANAGIARPGLFADQPLADHDEQMRTNYFGALHLARAAVPAFAPGGRLVFVASGAALVGIIGYSAYAPSKFALRGLAEVLRVELAERGIAVTLALPPDTDTPQLAAENVTKPAATKRFTQGGGVYSADVVAATILAAAERGIFMVTNGLALNLIMRVQDLAGPCLRWSQRRVMRAEATKGDRR
ncbi:MAG: SDR family oxidoreductase [Ancalomicrobiaceae bacterium]|nr:SDR family oxidoreductase [Ancalomicrobiaceae bacterium]